MVMAQNIILARLGFILVKFIDYKIALGYCVITLSYINKEQ